MVEKRNEMLPILKPALPSFEKVSSNIKDCFDRGQLIMGKYVRQFEEEVSSYLGVKHAIATSSCTVGLTLLLSTLPKNSEVIMPSYTFAATAAAASWNNLRIVFADCDEYCNLDPKDVKKKITKKTSAILGVHMFGVPCDIEGLTTIAKRHDLKLFFDAAHAFGSEYRKKKIGRFGDAEVFSLGVTKAFATGEGGIITTNDDKLAKHMRLAVNNGRPAGSINPNVLGTSARFQEFNAIIGLHTLKVFDKQLKKRQELAKLYNKNLSRIKGIRVSPVPDKVFTTYKDFTIFIDEKEFGMTRDELYKYLHDMNIQAKLYFWPPVHKLDYYKKEYGNTSLPNTEKLSSTTISLPFFTNMTEEDVKYVCEVIREVSKK